MTESISEHVQFKLGSLPANPGVYLMKNEQGRVIYVGKAKSLRSRVRSYFNKGAGDDGRPQLQALVAKIRDIDYVVTESDKEALILESNYIKIHRPRYNIYLKDDKKYPFIRITHEAFPRIFWTRDIMRDGSRYLGPYHNAKAMRTALDVMHKIFPVRSCDYDLPAANVKLCLEHQIHRCDGPCESLVEQGEYRAVVDRAVRFLKGNNASVVRELEQQMTRASREMRYEQAARLRDQIHALQMTQARQKVVLDQDVNRDVIGLSRSDDEACCTVLEIREGRLLAQKHHFLNGIIGHEDAEIVSAFVGQFYLHTDFIPREIHCRVALPDATILNEWLSTKADGKVEIAVSQRGLKARSQEMADINAGHILRERQMKRELTKDRMPQAVVALQRDLGLQVAPRKIEGIDISNFQGTDSVGSVVCVVDGKPRRSEYRHFRVKGVSGADDFASIREVVLRRFRGLRERGEPFPDLLMVDGGKGQLSNAVSALRELGIQEQPVIGLAKRLEEVFVPGGSEAVLLPRASASLRLLQTLRDEAHRFALKYHQKLRGKRMVTSELDGIPGVGPGRRQALLQQFGSVHRLRSAPVDEIAMTRGVSLKIARAIKEQLAENELRSQDPEAA